MPRAVGAWGQKAAAEQGYGTLKRVGIAFTRKAVEKAVLFGVGAVIGSTVNAGITTYVGHQARKHLEIDVVTE